MFPPRRDNNDDDDDRDVREKAPDALPTDGEESKLMPPETERREMEENDRGTRRE